MKINEKQLKVLTTCYVESMGHTGVYALEATVHEMAHVVDATGAPFWDQNLDLMNDIAKRKTDAGYDYNELRASAVTFRVLAHYSFLTEELRAHILISMEANMVVLSRRAEVAQTLWRKMLHSRRTNKMVKKVCHYLEMWGVVE